MIDFNLQEEYNKLTLEEKKQLYEIFLNLKKMNKEIGLKKLIHLNQ